jgi:hypothetical protein
MDAGGRSALREDTALTKLKNRMQVPTANSQYDNYLLRFLRNKNLDVEQAAAKLARRREYDKTLPMLSVSEDTVAALRSKAFALFMSDVMRRPVLYIRMGLHRFTDSTADETLAIIILEYIQYVVYQQNVSEFVVLINEENTGWIATKSAMQDQLIEILQKYYPEMVGQVLIVNASWVVQQGVRSTVASQPSKLKNRTRLVRPKELNRFFASSVIPQDLGGSNNTAGTATEFAEQCLRYWYNMTLLIQHEMANSGGALRVIWQPVFGLMSGIVGNMLVEKRNSFLHSGEGAVDGGRAGLASPTKGSARGGSNRNAPSSGGNGPPNTSFDDTTDDGCCSVISEQDLDQIAWENKKSSPTPLGGEDSTTFTQGSDSSALRQQLQIETQRRRELEHRLASLELGAPVHGQTLTRLESALRTNHEEVNVLIAEVILKGKDRHRGDPSLASLLELTNNALLQVTQEKPNVPAMKNSAPIDRKPPSSCTIS